MRFGSFRVINYKSFADSTKVLLEPDFNVIVGRNNVGKTALAEAMSLRFQNKPHLSMKTVPTPGAQPNAESQAEVSIRLEPKELADLLHRELPAFYVRTAPGDRAGAVMTMQTALTTGISVEALFGGGSLRSASLSTHAGLTTPNSPGEALLHFSLGALRVCVY